MKAIKKNVLLFGIVLASLCTVGFASEQSDPFPQWYLDLRDAVYARDRPAEQILPLFRAAAAESEAISDSYEKNIMLSRCEYMMGRAYQNEDRNEEASPCYARGQTFAENAFDIKKTDIAYQMMAENISQSCAVNSTSYAMKYGLKVLEYTKKALELNGKNAACLIIRAGQYVYSPWPLYNYQKGIRMLEEAYKTTENTMQKDDRFNIYCGIGYAYIQWKKPAEARPWLEKALGVYPTNQFIKDLLEK
ncbi:MAG: tetratricopeptide repeat protein [Spirochaetaceae bacterium]|jgi:tetratricopeptide (TPR) repeat protein|nr:tetratricopeptide repeat protein [Spirochaetaceae bacterium]